MYSEHVTPHYARRHEMPDHRHNRARAHLPLGAAD